MIPSRGRFGSNPRLPETGVALLILLAVAMSEELIAALRKVMHMIKSIISANPIGMLALLVVGVTGSPSRA